MPADLRYAFLVDWLDPQASFSPLAILPHHIPALHINPPYSPRVVPFPRRSGLRIVTEGLAVVQAQLVRQYLLFYYTIDNTVEMVFLPARCCRPTPPLAAPPRPAWPTATGKIHMSRRQGEVAAAGVLHVFAGDGEQGNMGSDFLTCRDSSATRTRFLI